MKKIITLLALVICLHTNAQYTKLVDFNNTNGYEPSASLITDGTYFYGTTPWGGVNNMGVIYKIKPDGTGFDTLINFNGQNGQFPSTLYKDSACFYGTTSMGGVNNKGVMYKINANGTGYNILFHFSDTTLGGALSVFDGVYFYGITGESIFRIKNDGTNYDTLFNFSVINGLYPSGALYYDGVYLYGMTAGGGSHGYGCIYKIKTDGSDYAVLYEFGGFDGSHPTGGLIYDGTYFYGETTNGSYFDKGVLFKIKPDGTGYTLLAIFENEGKEPSGSLFLQNPYLYGTTVIGGTNDNGVIFKIKIDGTGYDTLLNFNGINGDHPNGALISDGVCLYGTTNNGGIYGDGVVFKFQFCAPPIVSYALTADATPHIWDAVPSISGDAVPYTCFWSWGDGSTSDTLYTSHTYTTASHYNICLTVTDSNGCSAQYCENDSLYRFSQDANMIQINVVNSTSGISQVPVLNSKISIYPNPANSILQITGIKPQDEIKIYDVLGNQILQSNQNTIDISNLSNGVYFVRIGNQTQKIIKQ